MAEQSGLVIQAAIGASEVSQEDAGQLWALTYEELKCIAYRMIRRERAGLTLSGTAVVHEAYVRLGERDRSLWQDRAHFLAAAARVCRRVLVDHARERRAHKRGGANTPETLDRFQIADGARSDDLLDLHEALERLEQMNTRMGRIVEYRYFGGLTEAEVGRVLGVSERTVRRDWVKARGWLYEELRGDP